MVHYKWSWCHQEETKIILKPAAPCPSCLSQSIWCAGEEPMTGPSIIVWQLCSRSSELYMRWDNGAASSGVETPPSMSWEGHRGSEFLVCHTHFDRWKYHRRTSLFPHCLHLGLSFLLGQDGQGWHTVPSRKKTICLKLRQKRPCVDSRSICAKYLYLGQWSWFIVYSFHSYRVFIDIFS